MMDLSKLMNLKVEKPSEIKAAVKRAKTACSKGGDFLVTRSGKILFSGDFRMELENPDGTMKFLDIIDGSKMNPPMIVDGKPLMLVAIVPNKSPRASIQQEGKVTFIEKQFKQLANSIFGVNWETSPEVEFKLVREAQIPTDEPKFYFPCNVFKKDETTSETVVEPAYNKRNAADTKLYPCVLAETQVVNNEATQAEISFPEQETL